MKVCIKKVYNSSFLIVLMKETGEIINRLQEKSNQELASKYKSYLKSPFEFYGLRVPELRKIAKKYQNLELSEIYDLFDELWNSGNHEEKSIAIFLLSSKEKQFDYETWKFAISKVKDIKTWDHCDAISSWVLGKMLAENITLKKDVENLAESKNPWERRAAIISTGQLIKERKLELTFKLAEKLIYDEDVYVQKGAGWMLREAGKRERLAVKDFILMHLDMKAYAFSYATEKMKELRKIKKQKEKVNEEEKKSQKKNENSK